MRHQQALRERASFPGIDFPEILGVKPVIARLLGIWVWWVWGLLA